MRNCGSVLKRHVLKIYTSKDFYFMVFIICDSYASCILAMAWASICPSVRVSVTPLSPIKMVQASLTKSPLWVAPRTLVFSDKILCFWMRRLPSNEGIRQLLFCCYWLLLLAIVQKRLQIGTDFLHILQALVTGFLGLSTLMTLNDLEPIK